jgi:cell wall-associated NlpC family hydrolase
VRGMPLLAIFSLLVLGLIGAPAAGASTGGAAFESKPRTVKKTKKLSRAAALVPGQIATIGPDGLATVPVAAPAEVRAAIEAANRIIGKPYKYGGGHAKVEDRGYDCSGTVSYALLGAKLLKSPLDSSSFMRWGEAGEGQWITVYTNPGHAFVVIAGLRLDTSAAGDPSGAKGPRWRPTLRSTRSFRARHPEGF